MFVTKRALRKENRKLKELLQKCQNLQSEVKDSCLNANCILCEHCVMPQSDLPFVLVGCRLERACAHFSPKKAFGKTSAKNGGHIKRKLAMIPQNGFRHMNTAQTVLTNLWQKLLPLRH